MPRRKFYSFYVRAAIDRDTMEWTTKFPRSKPCTHLLHYLSLAGFVCGFSVLNPSVAYAGEGFSVLNPSLVYLINRWTMLEKTRKSLSEAILVAIS